MSQCLLLLSGLDSIIFVLAPIQFVSVVLAVVAVEKKKYFETCVKCCHLNCSECCLISASFGVFLRYLVPPLQNLLRVLPTSALMSS